MAPKSHRSTFVIGTGVLAVAFGWGLHSGTTHAEPSTSESQKSSAYRVTREPEWVRDLPLDGKTADSDADASNGAAILLVDRQIRIENGWSEYDRYVTRVVNPAGIDDASQVTITFDPELDRLRLHAVTLHRGGKTIDELEQGRIELLHRESHLEQATLDGAVTLHLVMSDVRVGDRIDCRYTLEHHSPTWGNRFFGHVLVRWDDPVRRSRLRVLVPAAAPLYLRAGAAVGDPVTHQEKGWTSLEWRWDDLQGVASESGAPSWYEQYPEIQFSQFAGWPQIVSAELPLFAVREPPSPERVSVIERLRAASKSRSGQALAALRFVQEQIRYTALELGTAAYRPSPPDEVLRRRYGDCKDKALLAVTLLRALGVDAEPALVSARWREHLHERLPSPADFDHAIVRVRLGGRTYWIDPTLSAQGGRWDTLAQADFGEALVIAPGISRPERIPAALGQQALVASRAIFDLRTGLGREAQLTVSTVFRGSAAEDLRRRLRRVSPAQLGLQYLNYYRTRYADIRSLGTPQVRDDLAANEITVDESYGLAHPFEASRPGESRLSLVADVVSEYLTAPARTVRTTPVSLHYPVDILERITVRLPHPLTLARDGTTIDAPGFRYESRMTQDRNDIVFDFRYRTLADAIPVDRLADFLRELEAARQDTQVALPYPQARPRLTLGAAIGQTR